MDTLSSTGVTTLQGRCERRHLTVMFADIVKSSRLIFGADPESANEILLLVLGAMTDAIRSHGGTVLQVLGDGVLAAFGAPVAQEDHAKRACFASHEMHRRVEAVARTLAARGYPGVRVRAGIDSGEVLVEPTHGYFGADFRVVGEPVYVAARLQAAARPGSTLLSDATRALVEGVIKSVRRRDIAVGPRHHRSNGYLMLRPSQRMPAAGRTTVERSTVPMFGREALAERFRALLAKAAGGKGQAVHLWGGAGIGKSRFLTEFIAGVDEASAQVVRVALTGEGLFRAREPVGQLVLDVLGVRPGGSRPQQVAEVTARLNTLGFPATLVNDVLRAALDLHMGQRRTSASAPDEELLRLVQGVVRVVVLSSRKTPLVLVIDDSHWADGALRDVLTSLTQALRHERVLLVLAGRHAPGSQELLAPHVHAVEMQPLDRQDSARLVAAIAGGTNVTAALVDALVERTGGNPFFLTECVRDMLSRARPGATVLRENELGLPANVQAVLATRIDGLEADDRDVLLAAAVIGDSFDVRLLGELLERGASTLGKRLGRLASLGFLREARVLPNWEFSFEHGLVREVAYANLLHRVRQVLHDKLVDTIKRRSLGDLPDKPYLLAHHAFKAKRWSLAVAYGLAAGRRALDRARVREAATLFENALVAAAQMADQAGMVRRRVDASVGLARCRLLLGDFAGAEDLLESARRLATPLGDGRRLADVMSCQTVSSWAAGRIDRAVRYGRKASRLARDIRDLSLMVSTGVRLGTLLVDRAEYEPGCELLDGTVRLIPAERITERFGLLGIAAVGAQSVLARGLAEIGRFDAALAACDSAITLAEDSGDTFSRIYAYLHAGCVLVRKGDFARSQATLENAVALCGTPNAGAFMPLSKGMLGYALARNGDARAGLHLIDTALSELNLKTLVLPPSLLVAWGAEAHALAGEPAKAETLGRQALETARARGERGHEAWALWVLGVNAARTGAKDAARAEALIHGAKSIAGPRRMAPLDAHCNLGLGRLYSTASAPERAAAPIRAAVSGFDQLGMTFWSTEARAEGRAFAHA